MVKCTIEDKILNRVLNCAITFETLKYLCKGLLQFVSELTANGAPEYFEYLGGGIGQHHLDVIIPHATSQSCFSC